MRHTVWTACLLCGIAFSQDENSGRATRADPPAAEFNLVRVRYATVGGAGSRGIVQPWWAIDYPLAEAHFLAALRRLTTMSVADDSIHLELGNERIYDYPFLFLQQPGNGRWRPSDKDAANLREYLRRGGFLLIDDLHGDYGWEILQEALQRVFPDRPIVDIPRDDALMNVIYSLNQDTPIPGRRHLRIGPDGQTVVRMEGPQHWRGVYDDRDRLMIAINFNMDMGDAWEHEDDPGYPLPMTALAYQFGVNYVTYAMTH